MDGAGEQGVMLVATGTVATLGEHHVLAKHSVALELAWAM